MSQTCCAENFGSSRWNDCCAFSLRSITTWRLSSSRTAEETPPRHCMFPEAAFGPCLLRLAIVMLCFFYHEGVVHATSHAEPSRVTPIKTWEPRGCWPVCGRPTAPRAQGQLGALSS